jgi:hypothetical protein
VERAAVKYYVKIESRDGVDMPTTPEPMELGQVGKHITNLLVLYGAQGYFSNCRAERIPVGELEFRIVPE